MSEPTIHVRFVDLQTTRMVAETDLPLSALPQSFVTDTQVELAGEPWQVVAADPATVDLFAQTCLLTLTLRPIHRLTPDAAKDILYSLPTICATLAPTTPGTHKRNRHVLEIHEDDWRQIEFVSSTYVPAIHEELQAIRHIYATAAVGPGFRAVHVRERIPVPMDVPWSVLEAGFPHLQWYDGLAYQDADELVTGGFACRADDFTLFGHQHDGTLHALCIAIASAGTLGTLWKRHMQTWMAAYGLLLADWCRGMLYTANEGERFESSH